MTTKCSGWPWTASRSGENSRKGHHWQNVNRDYIIDGNIILVLNCLNLIIEIYERKMGGKVLGLFSLKCLEIKGHICNLLSQGSEIIIIGHLAGAVG